MQIQVFQAPVAESREKPIPAARKAISSLSPFRRTKASITPSRAAIGVAYEMSLGKAKSTISPMSFRLHDEAKRMRRSWRSCPVTSRKQIPVRQMNTGMICSRRV